jgi:hypothetical protein
VIWDPWLVTPSLRALLGGAHYACENASVRVPLTKSKSNKELEVYLLGIYPTPYRSDRPTIEHFMYAKAGCVEDQLSLQGYRVLPPKSLTPAVSNDPAQRVCTSWLDAEKFQLGIEGRLEMKAAIEDSRRGPSIETVLDNIGW